MLECAPRVQLESSSWLLCSSSPAVPRFAEEYQCTVDTALEHGVPWWVARVPFLTTFMLGHCGGANFKLRCGQPDYLLLRRWATLVAPLSVWLCGNLVVALNCLIYRSRKLFN